MIHRLANPHGNWIFTPVKKLIWAYLIRQLERVACRLPDLLILDTDEYAAWFQTTHSLSSDRFRLVPTGADDRVFRPVTSKGTDDGFFRVIYYGTFIPNHGVEYIIEAARLLRDDETIRFELIGQGPDKAKAMALAQRYTLFNVTFVDWLEKPELPKRVAQADICLGAFGTTPQSLMTIQNKIYEGLAMAKPVITGDATAIRGLMNHGEHVYLCERANPQALAQSIRTLQANTNLCQKLAENGYRLFHKNFNLKHNGKCYAAHLRELLQSNAKNKGLKGGWSHFLGGLDG